jgi:predicted MFS family arabinose efflux permease
MFALPLKNFLDRHNIYYGWVMAFLAFITITFTSAALSIPQVLILPMTTSFGWQISDVTTAIGVMFLILALFAPFGGALMLRLGITKVAVTSCTLIILGLILTVNATQTWHLYFSIGVCLGIASGILGLGLAATVATRWFETRRGLVVGILTSAFAAGQLAFVPITAWLTTRFEWQFSILPILIGACLCAVLFFLFGKNWPSDLDVPPYGSDELFMPPNSSKDNPFLTSISCLIEAIKHPAFWVLAITFFICGLTSNGLISQHFIPFCSDNNIGIVVASSYLAVMGIFNFIGTMSSGWLSDRYDNYKLLAFYYGFRGLSLLYLPYSELDVFALSLWAIFFGLDFIATVPPTVRLTGKFFGPVKGPVIFGWIYASHQIGAAIAAYGAGEARDAIMTYGPIFFTAGLICFMATALIILFRASTLSTRSYSQ